MVRLCPFIKIVGGNTTVLNATIVASQAVQGRFGWNYWQGWDREGPAQPISRVPCPAWPANGSLVVYGDRRVLCAHI